MSHSDVVSMPDLYDYYMRTQGLDACGLPDTLYFTFCGDILGSSGEHYEKGAPISVTQASHLANSHFSDDFSESLAMYQLKDRRWALTPERLMAGRDEFLNIIKKHYLAYGQQYSPWAAALFEEKRPERYIVLLAQRTGCGGAMRAAALSPFITDEKKLLPFFLITHANIQAVEGSYIVWSYVQNVMNGERHEKALEKALEAGGRSRPMAHDFLKGFNLPVIKDISVRESIEQVLKTRDPYACINDIKQDGIETHYVVAASFLIMDELQHKAPEDHAAYVIERGLEIGGDPDTVCSITMSLAGPHYPEEIKKSLSGFAVKKPEHYEVA